MPRKEHIRKVILIGSGRHPDRAGGRVRLLGVAGLQGIAGGGGRCAGELQPGHHPDGSRDGGRHLRGALRAEIIAKIIQKEKPDGILVGDGRPDRLNMTTELAEMGALEGVEILGTPLEAIYRGEDREQFKNLMEFIGEPGPGP